MKKRWYINNGLLIVFVLIFIVLLGSTYSFFQASTNSSHFGASSNVLALDFVGDTDINQILPLGTSRSDGIVRTVKARLADNSMDALLSLYIKFDKFPSEFATEGFKYEVFVGNETTARSSGNFKNAKEGEMFQILSDIKLTHTYQNITIYLWLDGNLVGNELMNKSLSGSIITSTGNISGVIVE